MGKNNVNQTVKVIYISTIQFNIFKGDAFFHKEVAFRNQFVNVPKKDLSKEFGI